MEPIFPGNARVGPDAALRRRPLPGSARVSRVGFGVSPKQAFEKSATPNAFGLANARDARATQSKSALNSATVGRAQFCFAQPT
jgi:hypothetical protein